MISMVSLGSDEVFEDSFTDPEVGRAWRPPIMVSNETSGYFSTRSQSFPDRLNTLYSNWSGRHSTPHEGFGGMAEGTAGFGGPSRERSGRKCGTRTRAVMPLLGLILALIIIILILAILLVLSQESPPQASASPSDPNEPVDVPVNGSFGPREDHPENVTTAEPSTISPDFDWGQSLWSDMFEY